MMVMTAVMGGEEPFARIRQVLLLMQAVENSARAGGAAAFRLHIAPACLLKRGDFGLHLRQVVLTCLGERSLGCCCCGLETAGEGASAGRDSRAKDLQAIPKATRPRRNTRAERSHVLAAGPSFAMGMRAMGTSRTRRDRQRHRQRRDQRDKLRYSHCSSPFEISEVWREVHTPSRTLHPTHPTTNTQGHRLTPTAEIASADTDILVSQAPTFR